MRAPARKAFIAAAALLGLTLLASGCGPMSSNPTSGLSSRVGQARNAQAVSSLQQALITASVVASDGTSAQGPALASELQSRDPSNSYTPELPTEPGRIQVIGGGGGPLLLIGYAEEASGQPGYVAAWQSGATTRWYTGAQPPGYSTAVPVAAGWSEAATTIPASTRAQ